MISAVAEVNLKEVETLIDEVICTSVNTNKKETLELISHVHENLEWWKTNTERSVFFKYTNENRIVGVILIKEFWNLSDLFVEPRHQGREIGRKLVECAIPICRARSTKPSLRVNSSPHAVGFYKRIGFVEIELGKELPYGCVPLEYPF